MRWFMILLLAALPVHAGSERAGAFDYYVLSLGWSPTWCALTGDARRDNQCDARHDFSFTLHGLWPQNEIGWPSDCRTGARDPSRRVKMSAEIRNATSCGSSVPSLTFATYCL
jgi:ribonuclease T2